MDEKLVEKLQIGVMTYLADGDKKWAAKLLWPWLIQNQQTTRIWDALDKYPYLAIMGHASASKTFTCAAWFLLDWWSRSKETALMLTSDTIASMNRRVWSDIKILMTKTSIPMHGILVDSKRMIKNSQTDDKNAIAGVAAESDDAQSKIQGVHTKYIRVLIDEADNKLSQSIWGAISNLGSSGELRVVALANPVDRLTEFGMHVEPKDGWGSVNPDLDDEWESRMGWHVLRLDGLKSPNIEAGKDIYPFLLTNNGLAKIREEKGEQSREWWSYVRAWYPKEGTIQSVFSNEIIEKSRIPIKWYADTTPIASCDPAFEGGDDCVVCLGRMGRLASDARKTGIEVSQFIKIKRKHTDKPISIDFGDQILSILKNHQVAPENFAIDCTGNALGMSDYIQHIWQASTMPVNFGGSPTDMMITTEDTKKASERFDRFVSELWYVGREWMRLGLLHISSMPRDLAIQLEGRLYDLHTKNKIRVETKKEMKERRLKSPDCFVAGTSILTDEGEIPIELIKIGINVQTPFGYSPVIAIHKSKAAMITEATFSNGKRLIGKGGHKIFTWDNGWTRLDALCLTNHIESDINIPLWKFLNLLFTTGKNTTFKQLADTTVEGMGRRGFYTESSGKNLTELFLQICLSIIRMEIGRITASKIWSLWRVVSTHATTCLKNSRILSLGKEIKSFLRMQFYLLLHGIAPKLALHGINNTEKSLGKTGSNLNFDVYCAKANSNPISEMRNSVQENVPAKTVSRDSGLIALVLSVAKIFLFSNTDQRKPAPVNVQQLFHGNPVEVYNLTLAEHNAYYANGILVQNCGDAVMLLVHLARCRNKTATPGLARHQKVFDPLKRFKKVQSKFNANYGIPDPSID